ncbi:hypothetical protein BVY01_01815 [bacterium I07]|nr:hypothetical protein BVY01_01815 [bacterium I07]
MRDQSTFQRIILSLLFSILLIADPGGLNAADTGKIIGVIKDAENGQPMPGVNVLIAGTELGAATDMKGRYVIVNVPVGRFDLVATMMGYTRMTKTEVLVTMGRTSNVDFSLKSTVLEGETVTVVAERDVLHKEVSYSQEVITAVQIIEAPAIRSLTDFVSKQAGVSDDLGIRGGSTDQTGTIVNGLVFVNERLGEPEGSIPLSAVEQVSVVKGVYNAEYGNFRSGMVEVTTKTGSRSKYSGRFDISMNDAHMKRFGESLYSYNNFILRSELDPDVAFAGTEAAWANDDYTRGQYRSFLGWNKMADLYNRGKTEAEQATPLDLYLWDAWMHMVAPPFDRLAELGYHVPDDLRQKMIDHAHEPEGSDSDWNIDIGFGGPLPFLSKLLGNTTFYFSHNSNERYYVLPMTVPSVNDHTSMLTLQTNITSSFKMKINALYRDQTGVSTGGKANRFPTGVGAIMPANNINGLTAGDEENVFNPVLFTPLSNNTDLFGVEFTHTINPKTFWNFKASREHRQTEAAPTWANLISIEQFWTIEPQEYLDNFSERSNHAIAEFGPIKVNEMPYYYSTGNIEIDGFAHSGHYEQPFGSNAHRFAQIGPSWFDSTRIETWRIRFDMASQVNYNHFIKAGLEVNYTDFRHNFRSHWYGHTGGHQVFQWNRYPIQAGFFFQDQMSYEGVVANLGFRVDYYNPGGKWPETDPYDEEAFTAAGDRDLLFENGLDLNVFDYWDQIGILKPVKKFWTVSPRLGLSFPVTEKSKFYFNYGHFRSLVPFRNMYFVRNRPLKQGIQELGNPNMEPPRTISYETGVEYNLSDLYLIRISGYFKDVTGQHGSADYVSANGRVEYDSWANNNYQDILGAEISITKNVGDWFTGWANFDFYLRKNGFTGKSVYYEDPSQDAVFGLYEGQESTFLPQPGFRANLTFHVPQDFGPALMGIHPIGGWMLSVLPIWTSGNYFTWNPLGKFHLQDNLKYPDYFVMDARLSKRFRISGMMFEAYLNVNNVFNIKRPRFNRSYAYEGNSDEMDYLASLHLPMYDSPEYDALRASSPEGYYEPGDDNVGTLRSDEKPYINDPNGIMWLFDRPRDIWFGVVFRF